MYIYVSQNTFYCQIVNKINVFLFPFWERNIVLDFETSEKLHLIYFRKLKVWTEMKIRKQTLVQVYLLNDPADVLVNMIFINLIVSFLVILSMVYSKKKMFIKACFLSKNKKMLKRKCKIFIYDKKMFFYVVDYFLIQTEILLLLHLNMQVHFTCYARKK